MLDLFIGRKVGITAIMLGTVGFIGGMFDKNFSKESRITIIIMVVASTFIYEIGAYLIGKQSEGLMVIALYEIGEILEDKAVNKSRKSIKELMNIKCKYYNLVKKWC